MESNMADVNDSCRNCKTKGCGQPFPERLENRTFGIGNLIPSTMGAAKAISLVIPALKDKMSGISYRVPTSDVSIVDLNVALKQPVSYDEI